MRTASSRGRGQLFLLPPLSSRAWRLARCSRLLSARRRRRGGPHQAPPLLVAWTLPTCAAPLPPACLGGAACGVLVRLLRLLLSCPSFFPERFLLHYARTRQSPHHIMLLCIIGVMRKQTEITAACCVCRPNFDAGA